MYPARLSFALLFADVRPRHRARRGQRTKEKERLFHLIFILLHTLLQLQTEHEEKCHKLADKFQSLNWSVSRRGALFEG